MKILLISHVPDNRHGGASRLYHMLKDGLSALGHETTVLHREDFGLSQNSVSQLLAKRLYMPMVIDQRLSRVVDVAKFDIVMVSSGHGHRLFKRLRRKSKYPLFINQIHGFNIYDDLAVLNEAFLGRQKASLPFRWITSPIQIGWDNAGVDTSDACVVQNIRDLSFLEERWGASLPVALIPSAVDESLIYASETITPIDQRSPYALVWFGTWEPRKGISQLPATFRAVRARHPQASLTLGGTGRSADALLPEFAVEDRAAIEVLGHIGLEEQVTLFNRCSQILFPSLSEGFGLAVVEAMCFGCTAVTTHTGVGADLLTNGVTGRVVYPSSQHLARAICATIEDDAGRFAMATAGRTLARGLTVASMSRAYAAFFKQELERHSIRLDRGARPE